MEAQKQTVSFRLDTRKKATLDKLAEHMDRDRTYILNEAIDAYLDLQKWQLEHIREGLRQTEAGEFVSEEQMNSLIGELTGNSKLK